MEQSRLSVRTRFPNNTAVVPYLININGQYEWVDDYLKFGDLIEEHMGKEARDFYFENLYDLLIDNTEHETPLPEISAPKEEKANGTKSRKTVRGNSKRLF